LSFLYIVFSSNFAPESCDIRCKDGIPCLNYLVLGSADHDHVTTAAVRHNSAVERKEHDGRISDNRPSTALF